MAAEGLLEGELVGLVGVLVGEAALGAADSLAEGVGEVSVAVGERDWQPTVALAAVQINRIPSF